jgi:hypothetical protein
VPPTQARHEGPSVSSRTYTPTAAPAIPRAFTPGRIDLGSSRYAARRTLRTLTPLWRVHILVPRYARLSKLRKVWRVAVPPGQRRVGSASSCRSCRRPSVRRTSPSFRLRRQSVAAAGLTKIPSGHPRIESTRRYSLSSGLQPHGSRLRCPDSLDAWLDACLFAGTTSVGCLPASHAGTPLGSWAYLSGLIPPGRLAPCWCINSRRFPRRLGA